jgi:hypothetical protein
MEQVTKKLKLLTVSECKCHQSCARKRFIKYDQLIRASLSADPLRFGTLVHAALEKWWGCTTASPEADPLTDAIDAIELSEASPIDKIVAIEMMRAYNNRWKDEPYEVIAVEKVFKTELINPVTGFPSKTWEIGGKLDVLVRDLRDGRMLVVEHKTSSEDIGHGSAYWRRLQIDNQISMYFVGGRSLGYDINACLYDVLGKPKLELLKATPEDKRNYKKDGTLYAKQRDRDETLEEFQARLREAIEESPERYLQRGEVVRLEQDEIDAAHDLWAVAREIRDSQLAKRFPRNPGSCFAWNRACEYFDVCTGQASLDDPTRFRKAESEHEELSNVT